MGGGGCAGRRSKRCHGEAVTSASRGPVRFWLGIQAGKGRVLHGKLSHLSMAAYLRKVYDLGNTQKYFCSITASTPTISLSLLKTFLAGWLYHVLVAVSLGDDVLFHFSGFTHQQT